ncbi:hypothetical protein KC352_g31512 [Hortaea werneckii]|nr:hypothetical protein KC352_g31512 [Hortaea werneckii]
MLYDINHITFLRATHNIIGVLIGSLPQAPQQNVFQGIPLELMPEEARLLCEKGVGYIVDDTAAHKQGFLGKKDASGVAVAAGAGLNAEERRRFQESMRRQGQAAAGEVGRKAEERKKAGLNKKFGTDNWNDIPEDMFAPTNSRPASRAGGKKKKAGRVVPGETVASTAIAESSEGQPNESATANNTETENGQQADEDETLFAPPPSSKPPTTSKPPSVASAAPDALAITPTTSYPPLTATPPSQPDPSSGPPAASAELPAVPSSYPLYRHLHENNYFMSPGLRFGCQYTAYPGDPLRFHSHFLCNGMGWDEEFDLMKLVGGGRLGTGVKKGYLIGGEEEEKAKGESGNGPVRTFCVEWGGM